MPRLSSFRDALILLLWGVGVLVLAGTGNLALYLHPSLQPFTLAGGILLILLAGFILPTVFSSIPRDHHHDSCCSSHDHDHGDHHGHDDHHAHASLGIFPLLFKSLILLIPVAIVFHLGGQGYTATMVKNRGVVNDLAKLPAAKGAPIRSTPADATSPQAENTNAPLSPAAGAMPLQVIDMLYALQMPSYREEFEGKETEMIAQYIPMTTGNPKGDRFQAVRMFITCCAADAKPVGVTVRADAIPKVPEMGWVKITGRPTFPMEGGKRTAILEASKVEPCDAPSEPFVY